MIGLPARGQIYLASGVTDMRKGMPGLAALVASGLDKEPLSGDVFVFRGRRGDQIKVLWYSGRFVWPKANEGTVRLSGAQFAMMENSLFGGPGGIPRGTNLTGKKGVNTP